jgi:hypothetical protein
MRVQRTVGIGGRPGREPRHISYGDSALNREIADLDPLAGQGHHALYVASLKMGSLVAGGELFYERAEAMLTNAGRTTLGLSIGDVAKTVGKGLDKGMMSPRGAPAWKSVGSRNDGILRWFRWFEQMDPEDFRGTKGSTLLRIFAAFAIAGISIGKVDIAWSIRQAAEGSGLSRSTVHNLLKPGGRAVESGYLKPAGRRSRPGDLESTHATTWHPIIKRDFSRQYGCLVDGTQSLSRETPLRSPELNLFHGRGNGWRIHSMLTVDEEVTVAEIATATGLTPATVRSNLKFLEAQELAFRVDRWTWRATVLTPDRSAAAPDGMDYTKVKRERHDVERGQYARSLAARRTYLERVNRDDEFRSRRTKEVGWDPDEPTPIFDPTTGEILESSVS